MQDTLNDPWIQVLGQTAIHLDAREPTPLRGSARILLILLVAAGESGATTEAIAECYWGDRRPASWELALRATTSRLQAQLPEGWFVYVTETTMRLVAGPGWVDAWRLEAEAPHRSRPSWVSSGPLYDGMEGIELVDRAIERLPQLPKATEASADINDAHVAEVIEAQRVIVFGPEADRALLMERSRPSDCTDINIVGDRGVLLPLGPYAIAFPKLREELGLVQRVHAGESAARAWQLITSALAETATKPRQRIVVSNAHELDRTSLILTALLVERGPLSCFSIVMGADPLHEDVQWTDFVKRVSTAGCHRIDLA